MPQKLIIDTFVSNMTNLALGGRLILWQYTTIVEFSYARPLKRCLWSIGKKNEKDLSKPKVY